MEVATLAFNLLGILFSRNTLDDNIRFDFLHLLPEIIFIIAISIKYTVKIKKKENIFILYSYKHLVDC